MWDAGVFGAGGAEITEGGVWEECGLLGGRHTGLLVAGGVPALL